jgi:PAS domain S-box-containing protein
MAVVSMGKENSVEAILNLLGGALQEGTLEDICHAVVEGVGDALPVSHADLFLFSEKGTEVERAFSSGGGAVAVDESLVEAARRTLASEDMVLESDLAPGTGETPASLVALRCGKRLCGVLRACPLEGEQMGAQTADQLVLLGRTVGPAVELARTRVALLRSEDRFARVAERNAEWIWELDAEGRYTYCSPVVGQLLGIEAEQMKGLSFTSLVAPEDKAVMKDLLAEVRRSREAREGVANVQLHRDGHPLNFRTSCIPRLTPGGAFLGFLGTHRDVTRELQLESELRHSQTMEAVGQLAGGIAHDFNNLLTGILGSCHLMLDSLDQNHELHADVCNILEAGERASRLTRQLLAIGRKQILFVKRLNVGAVLAGMEDLLRSTMGEEIEVTVTSKAGLPEVEADGDQLKHVLVQLALNARDAMTKARPYYQPELWSEQRGDEEPVKRFSVTADLVHRSDSDGDGTPVGYVVITVEDTGVGMPPDVQPFVFEPFFTTKSVGEGSGLGLSTSYGIVKQMGGDMELHSVPGAGTTFRILLPACGAQEHEQAESPGGPPGPGVQGKARILVVEDDATVRQLLMRMLKSEGYRVREARNGREALELCKADPEGVDLILTDMVMPQMTGHQFTEAVRELGMKTRILYMSGYSREQLSAGRAATPASIFVQKPFTRDDMLRKVRLMLEDKVPG